MKVEVNEKEKNEYKFPRLMQHKSSPLLIVLFTDQNKGTCLTKGNYYIGEFYGAWLSSEFTDFTGSITLSND